MSTGGGEYDGTIDRTQDRRRLLVGCLAVLGIGLALAIGVAVVVANSWRGWATGLATKTFEAALATAEIPEGERAEVLAHFDAYAAEFEAGRVTFAELRETGRRATEGPIFFVGLLAMIDEVYVRPRDGLGEAEREAGSRALARVASGLEAGVIDRHSVQDIAAPLGDTAPDGDFVLKPRGAVTDAMVRDVIALAQAEADGAGVPADAPGVDLGDAFGAMLAGAWPPGRGRASGGAASDGEDGP